MKVTSPRRPRQRVSPSPTGKDSRLVHGDITSSRAVRTKFGERKDQHQNSHSALSSQQPLENCSAKRTSIFRDHGCQHSGKCYKQQIAIVLVFSVVLVAATLSLLLRTAPLIIDSANISSDMYPSRSLLVKNHDGTNDSTNTDTLDQIDDSDNPHPRIVWLMSFPNRYIIDCIVRTWQKLSIQKPFLKPLHMFLNVHSGTSFIIHMTREATNCTTATNYGLEGEIRDKPSMQAIQGPLGVNGPWLELLQSKTTRIADTILTKTHCKGFCSGSFCGADRTFHTTRSFMTGCLTGNQGVLSNKGLRLTDKTYDKSLVKKAIHIFRHPLDNIVARFHLEYNEKRDAGNSKYTKKFPKNALGFRRWCYLDDQNRGLVRSRFVDQRLRNFMAQIPCFNEFYRYTQWHNLAFETTRAMNLPTMVLHYHEFSDNFTRARDRVIDFLGLPLVGEGINFDDGKVYSHYYTNHEKEAIRVFLEEFASTETWEQLKRYSYGNETAVTLEAIESTQVSRQ